jgi:hypothetical protein
MSTEDLQKALDNRPQLHFNWEDCPLCQQQKEWNENFDKLFSAFQKEYEKKLKRLKIAEEKNVEYAKLVVAQAQDYAEKLREKVIVSRKQLSDTIKNLVPQKQYYDFEVERILRKLEGSEETHYVTVGEAREKLKEEQK